MRPTVWGRGVKGQGSSHSTQDSLIPERECGGDSLSFGGEDGSWGLTAC